MESGAIPAIELSGPRVRLEPLAAHHADGLLGAADDEVFAWLPYPRPSSPHDLRTWIAAALRPHQRTPYAILVGDEIAGTTSYWYPDRIRDQVEIGSTWIGRPWWGSGVNSEAKRLLIDHAFTRLEFAKVFFRTDVRNTRSQRALEKLGAQRDGVVRRDWPLPDGTWRDSVYYSILRDDWPSPEGE